MRKLKIFWENSKSLRRYLKWNPVLWIPNVINILTIIIFMIFDLGDYVWVKTTIISIDLLIISYNTLYKKLDRISPAVEKLNEENGLFFINKEDNVYLAYSEFIRDDGDYYRLIHHGEFENNEGDELLESFRKRCIEKDQILHEFLFKEEEINYINRLRNINYILND